MIRRILDGAKTQTRRVLKVQPSMTNYISLEHTDGTVGAIFANKPQIEHGIKVEKCWCPYGKVGDRLWVRESWSYYEDTTLFDCIRYRADNAVRKPEFDKFPDVSENTWHTFEMRCDGVGCADHKWRSPIHMPRWASRITLEVTEVRVQRLQDISEADAIAEGVGSQDRHVRGGVELFEHRSGFAILWDTINGAGSWEKNPWVWAISFRRITA